MSVAHLGSRGFAVRLGVVPAERVAGGLRDCGVLMTGSSAAPSARSGTSSIIRELETGEPTVGRIDITMQSVEVQFGVACSHLQDGARVALPVADRSLYIPGG